jgi:hypothetical protein
MIRKRRDLMRSFPVRSGWWIGAEGIFAGRRAHGKTFLSSSEAPTERKSAMVRWVLGCRWICLRHQSSRDWWSVCDLIPVIEDSPGTSSHAVRGQATTRQGWFGRTVTLHRHSRHAGAGSAGNGPSSTKPRAINRPRIRIKTKAESGRSSPLNQYPENLNGSELFIKQF